MYLRYNIFIAITTIFVVTSCVPGENLYDCTSDMTFLKYCWLSSRVSVETTVQHLIQYISGIEMNIRTGITRGEVAVEVGTDMIVTGTIGVKESIATEAGAAVQVLIIIKGANMMMSGVVGAGPMEGTNPSPNGQSYFMNYCALLMCYLLPNVRISSASPVRPSSKSRRSPSPRRTPPRSESPDARNRNDRSPTPKDVSPQGRPEDSPSPRKSDADVSP